MEKDLNIRGLSRDMGLRAAADRVSGEPLLLPHLSDGVERMSD